MDIDRALTNYAVVKETGCWNWQSACMKNGYGEARIDGRTRTMHRFFFEHHNGKVPHGLCVCHRCNNKKCVNPLHLYAGTYKQNSADAIACGGLAHGESRPNSVLALDDVRYIRRTSKTAVTLAQELGISVWTIYDIRKGRRWSFDLHHRDDGLIFTTPENPDYTNAESYAREQCATAKEQENAT